MRWLAGFLAGLWLAVQAAAAEPLPSPANVTVLISSNGWHTGLVLDRDDIPQGLIPELADFDPAMRWFEFSWGSADYYPRRQPGPWDALKAAAGSAAVLHVVGTAIPMAELFPAMELVPVMLSRSQANRLAEGIDAAFSRRGALWARPLGPGLYDGFSRFYPAEGRFSLNRTCNTWTAEALAGAGVALRVAEVRRAEDLLAQLRPGR